MSPPCKRTGGLKNTITHCTRQNHPWQTIPTLTSSYTVTSSIEIHNKIDWLFLSTGVLLVIFSIAFLHLLYHFSLSWIPLMRHDGPCFIGPPKASLPGIVSASYWCDLLQMVSHLLSISMIIFMVTYLMWHSSLNHVTGKIGIIFILKYDWMELLLVCTINTHTIEEKN